MIWIWRNKGANGEDTVDPTKKEDTVRASDAAAGPAGCCDCMKYGVERADGIKNTGRERARKRKRSQD